jgi:alkyl hydroperoxide reductase subunit AhpC
LKALHSQYRKKNLVFISVSVDSKREKWVEAIKEDSLTWINVSDLAGSKNKAAELYQVKYIPQSFLINKDGIIVAKDLKPDDIGSILQSLAD